MTRNRAITLLAVPAILLSCAAAGLAEEVWIEPRCTPMPFENVGPFARLGDGSLLVVDANATRVSDDDGKTWSDPRPIYDGPKPGIPSKSSVLVRTREGALILVYMDMSTYKWGWDSSRRDAVDDTRLDVWSIRSLDDGKTWVDRQQVSDGYCGALIDMIQTSTGEIVVPIQDLLHNPGRHAIYVFVSADEGQTWRRSNLIDLGGSGHHDGAIEPTLTELADGRLWMLIRTNWDLLWEAYSEDKGRSWRTIHPSRIDASSAPPYLLRLASGRLALVWNRLYPEGKTETARKGGDGQLCDTPASWHRNELSLAFSSDDGKTWTDPLVIARRPGGGLSYPYLFEPEPGELWVTTRFSFHIHLSMREEDFVGK